MRREVLITADHAQYRGDVDDDSASLGGHGLQGIFATIKNAIEIQGKRSLPAFECTRISGTITPLAPAATRDVDEDIETTIFTQSILDCRFDFRGGCDIDLDCIGLCSVDVKYDHACSFLCKKLGCGETNSTRTTRHDGDFI